MTTTERVAPHSLDAERALLGALIVQDSLWPDVADTVTAEDFYRQAHADIWRGMAALHDRGVAVDFLTLKEGLTAAGQLENVGGPAYLAALLDGVPRSSNARFYAGTVKTLALKRRIIAAAERVAAMAGEGEEDAASLLDQAQQSFLTLSATATAGDWRTADQLAASMVQALQERAEGQGTGILTGLHDLDGLTGGMRPGNLIILAARPAIGKSALAMNIAWHVAVKHRQPCAVFSLEMAADELRDRVIGTAAGVSSEAIRAGRLHGDEWSRVAAACEQLSKSALIVDDNGTQSSLSIRAKARRAHAERPLGLVIVDYLQLMRESGKWERRDLEVGAMSRNFKRLAKELQVPVIAVCQLNRGPEGRTDHRPTMADLRESGALEQDADMVWLLYRDHVYNPTPENENAAELNVAKQRNGKTGVVHLRWDGEFFQFSSRWAA